MTNLVKKSVSWFMIFTMIISFITIQPIQAADNPFSDLNESHWAYAAIIDLTNKNIISGMGDGTYGIDLKVTREQFIKLLVCIFENPTNAKEGVLKDVSKDSWSNPYIYAGLSRGIFKEEDLTNNNFKPGDPMTRDTVALWVTRALDITGNATLNFADSDKIKNKQAVANATEAGIFSGYEDGTFRPENTLTRAEAAVIIKKLVDRPQESDIAPYDPNDFNPDNLRESPNEVILQDNVKKIEPEPETNVLVVEDAENGYYVFDNITSEIEKLKTGDIFVIYPCESVPRGVSIKVKDIKITGTRAEVWQGDLSLEEVFESIDIAMITDFSLDDINLAELPEGVTVTEISPVEELSASIWDYRYSTNDLVFKKFDDFIHVPIELAVKRYESGSSSISKSYSISVSLSDEKGNAKEGGKVKVGGSISGTLSFEASPKIKIDIKDGFIIPSLERCEVSIDLKNSINLTGEIGASFSKEVVLWKSAPIPIAGPICIQPTISLVLEAGGKLKATVGVSSSSTNGFVYENGNFTEIKKQTTTVTAKGELEASLFAGVKFDPDVTILTVVGITLTAKVGGEITARLPLNNIGIENGITFMHIDFFCVEGDINVSIKLAVEVSLGALGYKAVKITETFTPIKIKITDYHLSKAEFDSPFVFELTKCPNKYYAPEITKQPVDVEVAQGGAASFSVAISTERSNQEYKYQWLKNGNVIPGATNPTYVIDSVKDSDDGKYECYIYNVKDKLLLSAATNTVKLTVSGVEDEGFGTSSSLWDLVFINPFKSPVYSFSC